MMKLYKQINNLEWVNSLLSNLWECKYTSCVWRVTESFSSESEFSLHHKPEMSNQSFSKIWFEEHSTQCSGIRPYSGCKVIQTSRYIILLHLFSILNRNRQITTFVLWNVHFSAGASSNLLVIKIMLHSEVPWLIYCV